MSTQVERLESLLQRVGHNRTKPRGEPGAPPASIAQAVAAPLPEPSPPAPIAPAPAAPAPVRRPAPTPLEEALEAGHGRGARAPQPFAPPVDRVPVAVEAYAPSARAPESVVLVDPPLPQPSRPIAHAVSKAPPAVAPSFGELLRRSLAAKPH